MLPLGDGVDTIAYESGSWALMADNDDAQGPDRR